MTPDLLTQLLSQPTAPFREQHVISFLREKLKSASVPHFQDPIGNIVLGVKSKQEYLRLVNQKSTEPLRVFIAHMDHPGFHGAKWNSASEFSIQWHGGSPTQSLEEAQVWIADETGYVGSGKILQPQLHPHGRALNTAVVQVLEGTLRSKIGKPGHSASALFGGFAFRSPVWKENDLIYTKAADDLVGTFAILSLALKHWGSKRKKKTRPPFLGLLTRAEEVGFIGAIGHFELGWLHSRKRPILCVSLETSRTLPGAEIGKGPVVRLGDRFSVFHPGELRVLTDLAESHLSGQHQRRIMDGGTCEASAALVYGFPAIGISVPLGNYHNQGFEGGPDSRPAQGPSPEFVHQGDLAGLVTLCEQVLQPKLPWKNPWLEKRRSFKKSLVTYRRLLKGHEKSS